MRVNANYTWLKCLECGEITKILPGQKFNSVEEFAKVFQCECDEATKEETPLEEKTIRELREEAKELGIESYSKMNKDTIQEAIRNAA